MSYGYGYPYRRSRRRRRGSGCLVQLVRIVVFFCVLGVVGSIAQQYLDGRSPSGGPGGSGWSPDGGDSGDIPPGTDEPPEGSDPGTGPSEGPTEPGEVGAVLQRNRFYTVGGLPDTDCPAPSLASASTEAQRRYDERVFGCLVRAWSGLLGKAGLTTTSPRIFVFDAPGTSPCGTFRPRTANILAFYCPANTTMYVDVRQMARSFPADHHVAYAMVLAHEYGHHLQNVSRILDAEDALAYAQPERRMEVSRRTETQASCFAGMFVRSIEESYPVTGLQRRAFEFYATHAFGDSEDTSSDERSHGTPQTQGRWIIRGFTENDTGDCNTFRAPESQVD